MSEPFVPIRPNPYIVGNPVRGGAMFFGREAEFRLVRERFQHAERGGLFVFCGERRSGKTSILFQILDRRLGPEFIPVLIDMQSMAVGSEAEFLGRLCEEILAALGGDHVAPPDFASASNRAAAFQRFVEDCLRAHPGKKLILLFDEYELFENKIDDGLLAEDVLYILAGLMERASVFMVFTGSQHLEQRRRAYWTVLGKSIYKRVSYLEPPDAEALVRQPVAGRVRYDDVAVAAILRLTAGQPFYTQAICQGLIDLLNERQDAHATVERVADVVDGIVNNPLPQMIFLWDGLERDDKLVLALLAEALDAPDAYASVDDLQRHLKRRGYPLGLDTVTIATTLEKLFAAEMLLRRDVPAPPAYALRMDLWRLWIRRQHSVWQVMREAGLAIRRGSGMRNMVARGVIAVIVIVSVVALLLRRRAPEAPAVVRNVASGFLTLEATPAEAAIRIDGRRVGIGSLRDSIAAGIDHRAELSAAGYADTAMVVRVERGAALVRRVSLRPLLGDLRVETQPPGAEVRVDGRAVGASPVTVRGLEVARPHAVEATRAGFGVARTEVTLQPSAMVSATLALQAGTTDVLVTTDPSGAEVQLDGTPMGHAPVTLHALALGRHRIGASLDGRQPTDTTLAVAADTRQVQLQLAAEPPGTLVVLGDLPAQIYVDGALVVENVQNSGPRRLAPGTHAVRVVLVSGETIDHAVAIKAGERATFDFSKGAITRRVEGGR